MTVLRQALPTLLAIIALGCGVMHPAHAQHRATPGTSSTQEAAPAARPWSSLTATQRDLLAPLQATWDTLPARRQERLLKRTERWATLPVERRAAIREHIAHWQQMTPEERQQARENRKRFHNLSPDQRQQLHATFKQFQQLPPAQRDKLLREWRTLTPAQRLRWSMPPHTTQLPAAASSPSANDHP